MNKTLTDVVEVPRTLLQDLVDDISDYAASRDFRAKEEAWRDDILARARAILAAQQPEPRAEVTDTERLDWLIEQQAWIQWTVRDGSIRQCQVFDQDEDENYHILSGEDRYFNTPREAIDAARAGDVS